MQAKPINPSPILKGDFLPLEQENLNKLFYIIYYFFEKKSIISLFLKKLLKRVDKLDLCAYNNVWLAVANEFLASNVRYC